MRTIFAAIVLLCSGVANSTLAQGLAGFYAGGQVGYIMGGAEVNIPVYVPDSPYSVSVDGFGVGVFSGYNHALSNGMIIGLEASANILATENEFATIAAPDELFTTNGKWEASLVARAGKNVSEYFLYGLLGATVMEVEGQFRDVGGPLAPIASDTQFGYTVGIGAERAFGSNMFVRLEYRFADYEAFDLQCGPCGPVSSDIGASSTINLGIGISF